MHHHNNLSIRELVYHNHPIINKEINLLTYGLSKFSSQKITSGTENISKYYGHVGEYKIDKKNTQLIFYSAEGFNEIKKTRFFIPFTGSVISGINSDEKVIPGTILCFDKKEKIAFLAYNPGTEFMPIISNLLTYCMSQYGLTFIPTNLDYSINNVDQFISIMSIAIANKFIDKGFKKTLKLWNTYCNVCKIKIFNSFLDYYYEKIKIKQNRIKPDNFSRMIHEEIPFPSNSCNRILGGVLNLGSHIMSSIINTLI